MQLSNKVFSKYSFLKIFLITFSILIWSYFLIASNASLKLLVIFDLPSIANTLFTFNFLLFLLLFPLTSSICIAMSTGRERNVDLLEISIGIFIGFILAYFLFGATGHFLLFGLLYLLAHIILSILTYNKFQERTKINVLSNYANSKISLLLTVVILIICLIVIYPSQEEYALGMQVGIVNMFVGDDIGNWLGLSYNIGQVSTKAALEYVTDSPEYKDLGKVNDPKVTNFTNFIIDTRSELDSKKTNEEIKKAFPDLNDVKLKNQILETFNTMPIMVVIQQYFAIIFAIIFASVAQLYFAIAFSLFGLLFVNIFYKLLASKVEEDDEETNDDNLDDTWM